MEFATLDELKALLTDLNGRVENLEQTQTAVQGEQTDQADQTDQTDVSSEEEKNDLDALFNTI